MRFVKVMYRLYRFMSSKFKFRFIYEVLFKSPALNVRYVL